MKMKKLFYSCIAVMTIAASFSLGAYASGGINLIVNGQKANADVEVIKGATYVSLRTVSELLGAEVNYDSSTKTIFITNNTNNSLGAVNNSTAKEEKVKEEVKEDASNKTSSQPNQNTNGRLNPAAIGVEVPFQVSKSSEEFSGKISVSEVIRGEQAWNEIYKANPFNSEPEDNHEYILAKINFTVEKNKNTDAAVSIHPAHFTLTSSKGVDYKTPVVVTPEPKFDTKLYSGSSHTGWVAFKVKKDDPSPLITYGRNYNGSGGVWFKTVN